MIKHTHNHSTLGTITYAWCDESSLPTKVTYFDLGTGGLQTDINISYVCDNHANVYI